MIRSDDLRHGLEESRATEYRYAGFGTVDGYIVYDTGNTAAWIESDTAIRPAEAV